MTAANMRPWFVYLLECHNGSIYTGISTDVDARFEAHCAGQGARYTRMHPPKKILATIEVSDRSLALKAEHRIKRLSAAEKRALAEKPPTLNQTIRVEAEPDSPV